MSRAAALAGALCISFAPILVRLAETDPVTVAFFRAVYALPALAVVWLAVRHRDRRPPRARALAVGAGVFLAIDLVVWHVAIEAIGAGLATVLANTQVVFVGMAAWMLHRERPTRTAFLVVPAVFVGVALLSGLGRADAYGSEPVKGVVLGLVTGLAYAGFLFVLRLSNRTTTAPASGPLLDAMVGVAAASLLIGLAGGGFPLAPPWPAHGWLLLLGLGPQVVGWLLITYALPRLAALETSVILLVQPVAAVLWARLIFTEVLSSVQWAGMLTVLAGVTLLTTRGTVRPAADRGGEPVAGLEPLGDLG